MNDGLYVTWIEVVLGGGCIFKMKAKTPDQLIYTTTSTVIQAVIISALLTGSKIKIETEGETKVVKRVSDFEMGKKSNIFTQGKYYVSQIKTQRKGERDDDCLEVVLQIDKTDSKLQFNVYDRSLQQILLAACQSSDSPSEVVKFEAMIDNTRLFGVTLGSLENVE